MQQTSESTVTQWPIPIGVRCPSGENLDIVDLPGALAKVDPSEYPVFWRAIQHSIDADRTTITTADGRENYMQIARQPFAYAIDGSDFADKAGDALRKHLEAIEQTLVYGEPRREPYAGYFIGFCGGVRHFLGRDLEEGDLVWWRPLRNPVLLLLRGEGDIFNDYIHEGEWLSEFSLDVEAHD